MFAVFTGILLAGQLLATELYDEEMHLIIGQDSLNPQFLSVTLENSVFRAVIRTRERKIKTNGPYDHCIRDWVIKRVNQDQVDSAIDGSAHRYACSSATLIADEKELKTVRLVYGDGSYVNDYTIYAGQPVIRVDYLRYDIESREGDWCNIVDIGTPGGISERFKAFTRIYGQEDWIRPLTYHEHAYWSIHHDPNKEIYHTIDDSTAGSLNYNDHLIMMVFNPDNGIGITRILPVYRHGKQGGVRVLKLLWDVGFEPFISTGQEFRPSITGYLFVFDSGPETAMHLAKRIIDRKESCLCK